MILPLVLLVQAQVPLDLDKATELALPSLTSATLGSPQSYRVEIKTGPSPSGDVVVGGRRVTFESHGALGYPYVQAVGRDGTAVLSRSNDGNYFTSERTIWRQGKETPLVVLGHSARIDRYLDAKNFAGSFYGDENDDTGSALPPSDESWAYVVEGGHARLVGRGSVVAWNPGGAVATSLKIDSDGKPVGHEAQGLTHVRVLEAGRTVDLGWVRCLGQLSDGTFVLADLVQTGGEGLGLYLWKGGHYRPWVRLPLGWDSFMLGPGGNLLVRQNGELGILEGTVLRPVNVADPRVATAMTGNPNGEWLRPDGSFAFSTSGVGASGRDERTVYCLTPTS